MDLSQLIELAMDNLLYSIIGLVLVLFILFRLWKTSRIYLGQKSYVKKAKKLDRKKFNGLQLIDKIKRKRKRDTNSFAKLKGGAKKKVKKYFAHKAEELPVFTRYANGKLFKRSKEKLIIYVKNERKTLKKIQMKKLVRQLIDLSNKYNCLDELINFLHNLPLAILDQQQYDIFVGEEDVLITYAIK